MTNKNSSKKDNIIQKPINDVLPVVERKIEFFKDVIQKTILHVNKNKTLDILGISDVNTCIEKLGDISKKIEEILTLKITNTDIIINNLQLINNELSILLKSYGTDSFEDLLLICFGNNHKLTNNEDEFYKFELLKKFFHPTSYKVIVKKDNSKKKDFDENAKNLACFDVISVYKQFYMKVYGIKLYIHSIPFKKSLIIYGILDAAVVDFLNNRLISNKLKLIKENIPNDVEFKSESFEHFLGSLTLKDLLINETENDVYNKYIGGSSQINLLKKKQIPQVIKEFINDDLYNKRIILLNLLIRSYYYENQYLAYLLYDLLSKESNGNVDSLEQTILFDSFPWYIKQLFKNAMKKTIQYTNDLSNFDINKIPLEQQICLLKVNDNVKEKAMMKLKEVKAKSEDSGSKARQYLDGLLKIPFGIYKKEPILNIMEMVKKNYKELHKKIPEIDLKEKYTSVEIIKNLKKFKENNIINDENKQIDKIKDYLVTGDKKKLIENIKILDSIKKKYNKKREKYSHLTKNETVSYIIDMIDSFVKEENEDNKKIINEIIKEFNSSVNVNSIQNNNSIISDVQNIDKKIKEINAYMIEVKQTLDKAVHGHDKAKKQIERIIGQWINGEQDGYCFGFEGPPGVGKTSLAKRGLSSCLKDENGNSRPFAMIQMGGDSNGSTLHGHNYTYVGSTWGSIVQILIDKKCMNPIIFIDEVDKISRTEHGKEIVGILTHLLDPAQNDCFQDKYFTGIDLDLSKALFILSYNDVESIDKILLDRVHRIKFENLSLEDKLVICNTHILPEVYKKMGLEDIIEFNDEVLKFIIDEYTCESGVRKLKEILFEIVGEINLDVLKYSDKEYELPIKISVDDIKTKYFKDKHEVKHKKIHTESKIGVINGLWANALGRGGVIPIQVGWRPGHQFLSLHLTGMQGDVMKESMNVALTLAWNLTPHSVKKDIREDYSNEQNINGVHIHCPEGATPKDGPSAGTAITTAIYSLLNKKKIKYNIAITGEICLNGNVTEIGGLDLKILGAIKAGVKEILFPTENMKDYNNFLEKYKDTPLLQGIQFHPVDKIQDVFELVFEE
jgi:ATP-dependent Lon protease